MPAAPRASAGPIADRTLPLLFAHEIQQAGIAVECDPEWGVIAAALAKTSRRSSGCRSPSRPPKPRCRWLARWSPRPRPATDGVLLVDGQPLTSERLRAAIDVFLLERGYTNPTVDHRRRTAGRRIATTWARAS